MPGAVKNVDNTTMKSSQRLLKSSRLLWEGLYRAGWAISKADRQPLGKDREVRCDLPDLCFREDFTLDIKLVFDHDKQITGLFMVPAKSPIEYKSPAYVDRKSFRAQAVTVGSGEWALPGTLTMPDGAGPFPAIVLIHGSGPNDRDETIGPNKPFRDLAEGLPSRGIAVLRYEKRTRQHSGKMAALKDTLTVKEEVTDDALLAVALLRKTEKIDSRRVFILGHSLGGMMVPRIAEKLILPSRGS